MRVYLGQDPRLRQPALGLGTSSRPCACVCRNKRRGLAKPMETLLADASFPAVLMRGVCIGSAWIAATLCVQCMHTAGAQA